MSDDHVLSDTPDDNTPDNNHTEWQDRLTDAALRAALGGETPPDLSEQILARTAELNASVAPRSEVRRTTPLRMAIAASLVLACGGLAYWGQRQDGKQRMVALLDDSQQTITTNAINVAKQGQQADKQAFNELTELILESRSRPSESDDVSELSLSISQSQSVVESKEVPQPTPPRLPKMSVDLDTPFRQDSFAAGVDNNGDGRLNLNADGQRGSILRPEVRIDFETVTPTEPGRLADASGIKIGDVRELYQRRRTSDPYSDRNYPSSNQPIAKPANAAVAAGRVNGGEIVGRAFASQTETFGIGGGGGFGGGGGDFGGGGRGPHQPGDQYARIHDNPFVEARGEQALSTLSIDVDTASYANVRRFLNAGQLPPADAVRIEELLNYFDYRYDGPAASNPAPFAADLAVTGCPWTPAHRLVRIGVKGREVKLDKRPLTNLVFLVDVSGSMNSPDKLPLVVEGLQKLTEQLGENDRVAIVVYASSEGLALPSTGGDKKDEILSALGRLTAGGSTAGGAGITLAYQIAEDHFIPGGTNRVILCTDGDFNVGTTSTGELERLVAKKAKQTGVFLSVCGFGRGNLNDAMMETVSNQGNGNYFYVDGQQEAEKVFVKGLTGTLVTIAKDVKIQVEFNPAQVAGYRLLGYENRLLAAQDFNDDKKDAGEIGAGHTVTALYEIVPAGVKLPAAKVDELKYQQPAAGGEDAPARERVARQTSDELLTLKMRYKQPDGDVSTKLEWTATDQGEKFADASSDTRFAAAVASFGMLLRGSEHAGGATLAQVEEIALASLYDKDSDPNGYRQEFVELVRKARALMEGTAKNAKNAKGEE